MLTVAARDEYVLAMRRRSFLHSIKFPKDPRIQFQRETMATTVANPSSSAKSAIDLPGRRYDHRFFSVMGLLMLATVFIGFARTYYLAGVFRAPLPSLIIHLHAPAFTSSILFLVTQTSLA